MSLTRDEWCKMWESIKRIEYIASRLGVVHKLKAMEIQKEVRHIKEQIQSVVGQME
jgi:hypothetical protein